MKIKNYLKGNISFEELVYEGTFRCPDCDCKVPKESQFCVSCGNTVQPKSKQDDENE